MVNLRLFEELVPNAAVWFHEKWGIPEDAYLQSMEMAIRTEEAAPRWYAVQGDGEPEMSRMYAHHF